MDFIIRKRRQINLVASSSGVFLSALEKKIKKDGSVLTEAQLQALEKAKE
jgi:hypothetical protein